MYAHTQNVLNTLHVMIGGDVKAFLRGYLPILDWLPGYSKDNLSGDINAGMVTAIMLVPQSMAYSMLAGLPPEMGLYASMLPLVLYAVFGSSRVLAVGPVALVSLMVGSTLNGLSGTLTPEQLPAAAGLLALMVGLISVAMGLLKLGFIVNFISHHVISGFTSAAALIIGLSQLKHLLGVPIPRTHNIFTIMEQAVAQLPTVNGATLMIGLFAIGVLFFFKNVLGKVMQGMPFKDSATKAGPLVVVVASTIVAFAWDLANRSGVKVVGEIPQGVPPLAIPAIDVEMLIVLMPSAILISFVGFVESVSIAKVLASRKRQKVIPNQELVGLGTANLGAAFSGGYPVTGGFSRSSVNFQAGANTPVAAIITAFIVTLTAAFLTPLLHHLPKAVLASIIMVAVVSLIDVKTLRHAWHYSKADGLTLIGTFAAVLATGIETGLAIGVVIAIALHLWRASQPHVAVLGRVPGTEHFRNYKRHDVLRAKAVTAARIDESLMFANAAWLEDWALGFVADNPDSKHLVLNCAAINYVDGSALEVLDRLEEELQNAGVILHLSDVKGPVMDRLQKEGLAKRLGKERIHMSVHDAMTALGYPM